MEDCVRAPRHPRFGDLPGLRTQHVVHLWLRFTAVSTNTVSEGMVRGVESPETGRQLPGASPGRLAQDTLPGSEL